MMIDSLSQDEQPSTCRALDVLELSGDAALGQLEYFEGQLYVFSNIGWLRIAVDEDVLKIADAQQLAQLSISILEEQISNQQAEAKLSPTTIEKLSTLDLDALQKYASTIPLVQDDIFSLRQQINSNVEVELNNLKAELSQHQRISGGHVSPIQQIFLLGLSPLLTSAAVNFSIGVNRPIQEQLDTKLPAAGGVLVGPLNLNNQRVTGGQEPIELHELATKGYVDKAAVGLQWVAVKVVTTANLKLSGLQVIDGLPLNVDDRVLVRCQDKIVDNGVYIVGLADWKRATDYDSAEKITKSVVVAEHSNLSKSAWLQHNIIKTVGIDAISFIPFEIVINQTATTQQEPISQKPELSGVTPGIYNNLGTKSSPFVVDGFGRITAVGQPIEITPEFNMISGLPTTLAGYGITDAASLSAENTLGGNLIWQNGTVIRTSRPTEGTAFISTGRYGTAQGDGCTHFGFLAGSEFVNLIRGVRTEIAGNLSVAGKLDATAGSVVDSITLLKTEIEELRQQLKSLSGA